MGAYSMHVTDVEICLLFIL